MTLEKPARAGIRERRVLAALPVGLLFVPMSAHAAAPPFSPIIFFAGQTIGEGSFKRIAAPRRATHVQGTGTTPQAGTIVLAQHILVEGKPARDRRWTLRALGGGRFTGVLTDAIGPVEGEVRGNLFHVQFRL